MTAFLAALIELLLAQLGHPAYRQREAAHRALAALGRRARPALETAECHHDPEVRQRVKLLQEPWAEEDAERDSYNPKWGPLPWLRCEKTLQDRMFTEASQRVCGWIEATRLWLKAQLLQRRPHAAIRRDLEAMRANEQMFNNFWR